MKKLVRNMFYANIAERIKTGKIYRHVINYLLVIIICYIISRILADSLWKQYTNLFHTGFELVCIFIAVCSFVIEFFTHSVKTHSNWVIGYGFLAVAVYDLFHTYYFPGLELYPANYYDLSTRYWVLGRFFEAIILFISSVWVVTKRINRWIALIIASTIPISISVLILYFPGIMPVLYTESGVTTPKIIIECIIIAVYIVCLFFIRKKLGRKLMLSYDNIFMAALIAISAELCFIVFTTLTSFYNTLGHVLKIVCYFYLFKGVFVSSIIYPYENLRKTKNRLRESKDELRHILNDYEEEQKKIQQQEKLAIIGEMGSGIVHETKNYLASIKGYCQLLSSKIQDEKLRKYIGRIESISTDLNKVIVEFLSLAKPKETFMDIISLNELIESMRYMLESPSFMKGIDIDITLSSIEEDIKADDSQIKQVILNIVKNAIEAMSETKDARLGISTILNHDRDEMQLIISDNGKGISEENLKKLGTPFFTTKETGTGLGLSVCYRIVKEHGGRIDIRSEENKGTTFTISFPCDVN